MASAEEIKDFIDGYFGLKDDEDGCDDNSSLVSSPWSNLPTSAAWFPASGNWNRPSLPYRVELTVRANGELTPRAQEFHRSLRQYLKGPRISDFVASYCVPIQTFVAFQMEEHREDPAVDAWLNVIGIRSSPIAWKEFLWAANLVIYAVHAVPVLTADRLTAMGAVLVSGAKAEQREDLYIRFENEFVARWRAKHRE